MSPDPTPPETAVLRYTVAPQFLEQHLELLRAVYTELNALARRASTGPPTKSPARASSSKSPSAHPFPARCPTCRPSAATAPI